MRLTAILLFLALVCLGSAAAIPDPDQGSSNLLQKRKCFQTGEKFGDQQGAAQGYSKAVCKSFFQGYYNKGQKFSKCMNLPGEGKSVVFTVGLLGKNAGSTRFLGVDECYSGLHKEVVNCGRGGETTYGNWYYRADPNSGRC